MAVTCTVTEVRRVELTSYLEFSGAEHEGVVATQGVISNSQLGCPSLQAEGKVPK